MQLDYNYHYKKKKVLAFGSQGMSPLGRVAHRSTQIQHHLGIPGHDDFLWRRRVKDLADLSWSPWAIALPRTGNLTTTGK